VHLIFGYGSIINQKSRASTLGRERSEALLAWIDGEFPWVRSWVFRSTTGFTALGLRERHSTECRFGINGIIFRVDGLKHFDLRETGYRRQRLDFKYISRIESRSNCGGQDLTGRASERDGDMENLSDWYSELKEECEHAKKGTAKVGRLRLHLWIYIPISPMPANPDFPICQSYVDTVISGCLQEGGEEFAVEFIKKTLGWCSFYLNDIPLSRRPWLHRGKRYREVDKLLMKFNTLTHVSERSHPEQFAARFLHGLSGMWGVPNRNHMFQSRDVEIATLSKLLSRSNNAKVQIVGLAGVGKTHLACEYSHLHYQSASNFDGKNNNPGATRQENVQKTNYRLVVWLKAESRELILNDISCASLDFGLDVKGKTDAQILSIFKATLYQSQAPWLLIFDNAESLSIVNEFAPRGSRLGHILITSRHMFLDSEQSVILDCFEAKAASTFLQQAAGPHAGVNEAVCTSDGKLSLDSETYGDKLVRLLGGLPLALAMAAAYMRRSDVSCRDYIKKFHSSKRLGALLDHRMSKISDYNQGVVASLSVTIERLSQESKVARRILEDLSFVAPEGISKRMVEALMEEQRSTGQQGRVHCRFIKTPAFFFYLGSTMFLLLLVGVMYQFKIFAAHTTIFGLLSTFLPALIWVYCGDGEWASTKRDSLHTIIRNGSLIDHSGNSKQEDDSDEIDNAWNLLKTYCLLIVRQRSKASMHRLLQEVMRNSLSPKERCHSVERCVSALEKLWTFETDDPSTWQDSGMLLEHIKIVASHIHDQEGLASLECLLSTANILTSAAVFMTMAFNRFEEAHKVLKNAVQLRRMVLRRVDKAVRQYDLDKSMKQNGLRDLAVTLRSLGQVLRYRGLHGEAGRILQEAIHIQQRLPGESMLKEQAVTLHELGVLNFKLQRLDDAKELLQESLKIKRNELAKQSSNNTITLKDSKNIMGGVTVQRSIAATLHQLGVVALNSKPPDYELAQQLFKEALKLERMHHGYSSAVRTAATLTQLGKVALRLGKLDSAEKLLKEALQNLTETYKSEVHVNIASVRHQLGQLFQKRGLYDEAAHQLRQALRVRLKVYGSSPNAEVARNFHEIGRLESKRGDLTAAEGHFTEQRNMLKTILRSQKSGRRENIHKTLESQVSCLCALKGVYRKQNRMEKAKSIAGEISELRQALRGRGDAKFPKAARRNSELKQRAPEYLRLSLILRQQVRKVLLGKKSIMSSGSVLGEVIQRLGKIRTLLQRTPTKDLKPLLKHLKGVETALHLGSGGHLPIPMKIDKKLAFTACDGIRDFARSNGVVVNDVV